MEEATDKLEARGACLELMGQVILLAYLSLQL